MATAVRLLRRSLRGGEVLTPLLPIEFYFLSTFLFFVGGFRVGCSPSLYRFFFYLFLLWFRFFLFFFHSRVLEWRLLYATIYFLCELFLTIYACVCVFCASFSWLSAVDAFLSRELLLTLCGWLRKQQLKDAVSELSSFDFILDLLFFAMAFCPNWIGSSSPSAGVWVGDVISVC